MLKKCLEDKLDWAKQLKYALFVCRSAPNRDSGLSPLEIIYGRHDMWDSTEKETLNVCEWVVMLQKRLEVVHDMLREKMTEAKTKQKLDYDKNTKMRHFQMGDMVPMRILGLTGKLEDSWDGPYEVNRKLNNVNYELIVPNHHKGKRRFYTSII